jgi:hypothetical protein
MKLLIGFHDLSVGETRMCKSRFIVVLTRLRISAAALFEIKPPDEAPQIFFEPLSHVGA